MTLANYAALGIPPELRKQFDKPLLTPEENALRKRILASTWLLLRNVYGFRCRRCNAQHAYFTSLCVEQPFNGLNQVVATLKKVEVLDELRIEGQRKQLRETAIAALEMGDVVPITAEEARTLFQAMEARRGVIVMPNGRVVRNQRRFV